MDKLVPPHCASYALQTTYQSSAYQRHEAVASCPRQSAQPARRHVCVSAPVRLHQTLRHLAGGARSAQCRQSSTGHRVPLLGRGGGGQHGLARLRAGVVRGGGVGQRAGGDRVRLHGADGFPQFGAADALGGKAAAVGSVESAICGGDLDVKVKYKVGNLGNLFNKWLARVLSQSPKPRRCCRMRPPQSHLLSGLRPHVSAHLHVRPRPVARLLR